MTNLKLLTSLCVALIFLFTACRTEPEQTNTTENLPEFKQKENIAYVRLRAEPDGLNPILARNAYARQVYTQLFPYLIDFDPKTLELVPKLATSRAVVEEKMNGDQPTGEVSYTFEIVEEAVWDDGSPVTGNDYVFTLKALLNPKVPTPYRPYYDFISGVDVDENNPKKFTVHTDKRYILAEASLGTLPIYPAYVYDPTGLMKDFSLEDLRDGDKAKKLAEKDKRLEEFGTQFASVDFARDITKVSGCGAYTVESWETGQRIILKKKPNWWGDEAMEKNPLLAVHPEAIHFKIIGDQTAALSSLKDEDLDACDQIAFKDFRDLEQNEAVVARFDLEAPPSGIYYATYINMRNPKLSDKRVRRALAHLMNVEEAIETILYGMGQRRLGPIDPSKPYFNKDLELIDFDLDAARSLLKEAGWEDSDNNGIVDKTIDGEKVEMNLTYLVSTTSENEKNLALLFQNDAKKAGVNLEMVAKDFKVKMQDYRSGDFELAAGGWASQPVDYDPNQIWHSQGGSNYVGFGNAETDELIENIRTNLNEKARGELYKEFQKIVYDEQPYIFHFSILNPLAVSKRFETTISPLNPNYRPDKFDLQVEN